MKAPFDHRAVCSFLLQMLTKILTNVPRNVQIVPKTEEMEIVRTCKMLWSLKMLTMILGECLGCIQNVQSIVH